MIGRTGLRLAICAATLTLVAPTLVSVAADAAPALVYSQPTAITAPTIHGLPAVNSAAVDSAGDVFLAEDQPGRVVEIAAGSVTPITLPFTGLYGPHGIAVDANGDVIVADSGHSRVVELAHGATTQTVLPFVGLYNPMGVTVDAAGDLFVADNYNNRVVELNAAHAQTVLPFDGMSNPESVAVHAGTVYVSDTGHNRVLALAPGATSQTVVPMGSVNQPHEIAVDGAGNLFVNANTLTELAAGGTTPTTVPLIVNPASAIATDAGGDLFVADGGILELPSGSTTPVSLPPPNVTEPETVAVAANGDLVMVDINSQSSRLLQLDDGHTSPTVLNLSGISTSAVALQPAAGGWSNVVFTSGPSNQVLELARGATTPSAVSAFNGVTVAGLAVDAAGDIFADDFRTGAVFELAKGASSLTTLPVVGLQTPGAITVDSAGDLFVVDRGAHVLELAHGQTATTQLPLGNIRPQGLAVDQAGDVFVTDMRLNDVDELPVGASAPTALEFAGLSNPSSLAVDASGDLYVADTNNGRVVESTLIPGTAPTLTVDQPPHQAVVAQAYSYVFAATGYPAPTFSVSTGSLPPGFEINPVSGAIGDDATTPGTYSFTVTASNAAGTATTKSLTITVVAAKAPSFTADQPADQAQTGAAYTYTFTATGEPAPTFAVQSGALPPGLNLDSTSGLLSGTPTATGAYSFVVRAVNGVGVAHTGPLSLTVVDRPAFTADSPAATLRVGQRYTYAFAASGYPSPAFAVSSGRLPAGLHLDGASGDLAGTPSTGGRYTYTVSASNSAGTRTSKALTMTVDQVPRFTADAPPSTTRVGVAYSYRFHAVGFPAPTYQTSGRLPAGITLQPVTGRLIGRATKVGRFAFDVIATNSSDPAGVSHRVTIVVHHR